MSARATTLHVGQPRLIQLDILRGIAILLVLFTHAIPSVEESGALRSVLHYLHYLGPSGVDLFFVLSGFLIGGLLFKEISLKSQLDVRRFILRRGFKIWPAYFAFLAFVLIRLLLLDNESVYAAFKSLLPNVLHVQNYFGSPRGHTWSLAVEEHFYLLLPFLLAFLARPGRNSRLGLTWLPAIVLCVCIFCAALRYQAYSSPSFFNPHFATHLRLDSLFFGVLIAYLHEHAPQILSTTTRRPMALLIFAVSMLMAYPALVQYDQGNLVVGTIGFVMLYTAYGSLLLLMIYTPSNSGRFGSWLRGSAARSLAFIGFYSYSIYLWHIDAQFFIAKLTAHGVFNFLMPEVRWLVYFTIYVASAVACGYVLARLIEMPALAIRDRLIPARGARHDA